MSEFAQGCGSDQEHHQEPPTPISRRNRDHTALHGYVCAAGLRVTDARGTRITVVAEVVGGGVHDDIQRFVAAVHRAGQAVTGGGRRAGLAVEAGIAGFGAVAEEGVDAAGVVDRIDDDVADFVAGIIGAGDAVVHHCEVIHRADPNRSSTRHRRAFAIVFEGVSCEIDHEAKKKYTDSMQAQHKGMGLEPKDYS